MKTCRICLQTKTVDAFYKQSARGGMGVRGSCKECDNKKKKEYRASNKDKIQKQKKEDYLFNQELYLAQKKLYRQANKGKIAALNARRKKHVKQRTPAWSDMTKVKSYYNVCAFFNEVNGYVKYHVDHIIPMQGDIVSGLHVHTNLQIMPWRDNVAKKNKFEVCDA